MNHLANWILAVAFLTVIAFCLWRAITAGKIAKPQGTAFIAAVTDRREIDAQFTEYDVTWKWPDGKERTILYVRRDTAIKPPARPVASKWDTIEPATENEKLMRDELKWHHELSRLTSGWRFSDMPDPYRGTVAWYSEPGHVKVNDETGQRIRELWEYSAAREAFDDEVIAAEVPNAARPSPERGP